ncbi:MAG: Rne/Rng family ribonuclease [Candidatus Marinimicrobia bacterium]|nr:Rne/Rng family ribonuclease [Candidatus Neomarinimicrobiota bacterium]
MDKRILISKSARETRVAILENGELVDFFVENFETSRSVGNIYKGEVENVISGIQAAFVDIGQEKNAFLPFAEVSDPNTAGSLITYIEDDNTDDLQQNTKKKSNRDLDKVKLKKGQEILVQVIKEPFGEKGARVSTDLSIAGRFIVLVPYVNYVGISKKIKNREQRDELRQIAKEIKPKGMGIILRTVTKEADREALESDLNSLLTTWDKIEEKVRKLPAKTLVYQDMSTASSILRDVLSKDVTQILVDNKNLYRRLMSYVKQVSPEYADKVELYKSNVPMFDQMNVEKEFRKSLRKKVWLKNGGFIVIEHTEAMATIDVNSGKFISKTDHEKISLKTNILAAQEIAKQLRLRDIGGLIVIDFIDMLEYENRKKVFNEMRKELKKDKAAVSILEISDFGLLEMTRQRTRPNLLHSVSEPCPLCHGSGRIISKGSLVTQIESWFRRFKSQSKERRVELYLHPEMANYLRLNEKNLIIKMQWKYLIRIKLKEDSTVNIDDFKVFSIKSGVEITDKY